MSRAKRPTDAEFEAFVRQVEPGLRRSHFAALGLERGREATAEALAWSWEHWPKVKRARNPIGYLFRVGQSRTRSKRTPPVFDRDDWKEPWVEPKLGPALAELSEGQRVAVVLVYGFGWTLREVANLRGTRTTTVQTHLERGLKKLQSTLGVCNEE